MSARHDFRSEKIGFRRAVSASQWSLLSKIFCWRLFLRFSATILTGHLVVVYQTSGQKSQFSCDFFVFRTQKILKTAKTVNFSGKFSIFFFWLIISLGNNYSESRKISLSKKCQKFENRSTKLVTKPTFVFFQDLTTWLTSNQFLDSIFVIYESSLHA